jgi:hypothetical protein
VFEEMIVLGSRVDLDLALHKRKHWQQSLVVQLDISRQVGLNGEFSKTVLVDLQVGMIAEAYGQSRLAFDCEMDCEFARFESEDLSEVGQLGRSQWVEPDFYYYRMFLIYTCTFHWCINNDSMYWQSITIL